MSTHRWTACGPSGPNRRSEPNWLHP